jgi:endonuclease
MAKIYDEAGPAIMAKWANENLKRGQLYTKSQIIDRFRADYPDYKRSTVDTRLRIMCVNIANRDPRAKPGNGRDLFFKESADQIRLWEPDSDPPPIYRADLESKVSTITEDSGEDESDAPESIQGGDTFALEKDLQNFLVRNLHRLEPGLELYQSDGFSGIEYNAGGRFIDILAVDANGAFVVIELKVSKGYDRVIGQLLRYMGWVETNLANGQAVRGMIVCSEITQDLELATHHVADRVALFAYNLTFNINQRER